IAETEEEDRGGICSIFTHIAHVLHEVEPTFNLRVRRALLAMAGEAIIVEGEGCQWQERAPKQAGSRPGRKIGRAHVCTPVTNAHLVCRLLLENKNIRTQ